MNNTFTPIDLSKLPAPLAVEALDFETIFQEILADVQERDPTFNALVESDPGYAILQAAASREVILRQLMNDKIKASMLAFAVQADLDHRGASMAVPVIRLEGEDDEAYRARCALSPEAYSVAGPLGAYEFHALSAHSGIKGAKAWNPGIGGRVNVAVLSKTGNGQCFGARINYPAGYADGANSIAVTGVSSALENGQELVFEGGAVFTLDNDFVAGSTELTGALAGALVDGERTGILPFVQDALNEDSVRPLCDTVEVMSAEIIGYEVIAELILYYGPDAAAVLANSQASAAASVAEHHACGRDVTLSELIKALKVEGVQDVQISSPLENVVTTAGQAAYCTAIAVTISGRDE